MNKHIDGIYKPLPMWLEREMRRIHIMVHGDPRFSDGELERAIQGSLQRLGLGHE